MRHGIVGVPVTRIVLACALVLFTGCSRLTVRVSVYNGPMVHDADVRLAWAVGLARGIRDVAKHTAKVKKFWKTGLLDSGAKDNETLLADLATYYGASTSAPKNPTDYTLNIGSKYETYLTDRSKQNRDTLVSVLVAYANNAQAIAQRIASPEIQRSSSSLLGLLLPWPERQNKELLAALIAIDESGRILNGAASSVATEYNTRCRSSGDPEPVFLDRINHVMASQKPGTLVTMIKNKPQWWYRLFVKGYIEGIYDEKYWDEINPIDVRAFGATFIMLVKDEVGNWHIKNVDADPSKVVEVAAAAVETLAAALIRGGL